MVATTFDHKTDTSPTLRTPTSAPRAFATPLFELMLDADAASSRRRLRATGHVVDTDLVDTDLGYPAVGLPDVAPLTGTQTLAGAYRRRRLLTVACAGFMMWLIVSTGVTVASWATGPAQVGFDTTAGEPVVHVVQPGDTVWSIVRGYQPNGDVRAFVDRVITLNGSTELFVGQELLLAP